MRIEELFAALENDVSAQAQTGAGWMLRLTRPSRDCPLFVALDLSTRRRAILLRLEHESIPPRNVWPACRGLEPVTVSVDSFAHVGVVLRESRYADVFVALCEDLERRIMAVPDQHERATVFLAQLSRWQKFLSAELLGLGAESQRGLWGELHFMVHVLMPILGPVAPVHAWKGGEHAHQDFQFEKCAIEIKTTLASQPQVVRIASERQLDDSLWPALLLHVISLDQRDGAGESLPAMVANVRRRVASHDRAADHLEDGLLAYGYVDAHAAKYDGIGYDIRGQQLFHVARDFPRLVEAALPVGIGAVSYGLSIAACAPFAVDLAVLRTALDG